MFHVEHRRLLLGLAVALLLAGCAVRPWIDLPYGREDLRPLGDLGYQHASIPAEAAKHLFYFRPQLTPSECLVSRDEWRKLDGKNQVAWLALCAAYTDPDAPRLVLHRWRPTLPFGEERESRWCWNQGRDCFDAYSWFPLGLPTVQGERCAIQTYRGPKIEPNLTRDEWENGRRLYVTEFHAVEQWAVRWKCTNDPTGPGYPRWTNMAGY